MRKSRGLVVFLAFWCAFAYGQDAPQSIKDALKRADDSIAKIIAAPDSERTFENTMGAFDDVNAHLDTDTGLFLFMANVSPDATVRAQSRAAQELVGNWGIETALREDLF